jgi:hypothetical protein
VHLQRISFLLYAGHVSPVALAAMASDEQQIRHLT